MKLNLNLSAVRVITFCLLALNVLSVISLYSSLHQDGQFQNRNIFYHHISWIAISWLFLLFFSLIPYRLYYDLSFFLYGLTLILLIAVIFLGRKVMGAQRWLSLGGISFQPSEISKVVTIFILARFFSSAKRQHFLKGILLPFILVFLSAILIFKQPDLGTAVILIILFFIMAFSSQAKKTYLIIIIFAGVLSSPFAWSLLKDYQKERLAVFLNPNAEPLGAGYTVIQSKIAIASGRIFGRGFLKGTQNQFNFLPERHTDFIFTVIAEEWGFLGSLFLLLIYGIILKKILEAARKFKEPFAQALSYGISTIFFLHIFINIGMTLGILPVVGLPLTFLSYGGTHLLVNFILVGIFFNICSLQR